ncbi:unnamed protein product [Lampetra fluviatilis]
MMESAHQSLLLSTANANHTTAPQAPAPPPLPSLPPQMPAHHPPVAAAAAPAIESGDRPPLPSQPARRPREPECLEKTTMFDSDERAELESTRNLFPRTRTLIVLQGMETPVEGRK